MMFKIFVGFVASLPTSSCYISSTVSGLTLFEVLVAVLQTYILLCFRVYI